MTRIVAVCALLVGCATGTEARSATDGSVETDSAVVGASTCTGTAFDTVIYLRSGGAQAGDIACSDDVTGCGNNYQSRFSGATVTGPDLEWLIVDGFGQTGNGNYTISYTVQ